MVMTRLHSCAVDGVAASAVMIAFAPLPASRASRFKFTPCQPPPPPPPPCQPPPRLSLP